MNKYKDETGDRRVALTHVGKYDVSTVSLKDVDSFVSMIDTIVGRKTDNYETMIFNRSESQMTDLYTDEYSTIEDARAGHIVAVALATAWVKGDFSTPPRSHIENMFGGKND